MTPSKSPFAAILTELLDTTGLFSRSEWATFLKVTPAAISQWVNDKTVPAPETLQLIVAVLKKSDDVPLDVLTRFDQMSSRPSTDVSRHGERLDKTLADYLLRPMLRQFFADYEPLSPESKEIVLREGSELCLSLSSTNGRKQEPVDARIGDRIRPARGQSRRRVMKRVPAQNDEFTRIVQQISTVASSGEITAFND